MTEFLFLSTVSDIEEGKKIAKSLIESRLAACVNIIKNVFSIYRWKGEIEEDNEHLLLIKTTEVKSESVIQKINEIHSYETPECIGFKIEKGSEKYLNWIRNVVD
ncbi:MAG: divalent-cation tolerance protein CutA [Promethearchaeota archaeon]|jgi:periplasmic divalent cation tolerance protein